MLPWPLVCHLFVFSFIPSLGTSPSPALGPRALLVAQHVNEVWLPWDSHPPPGAATQQADLAQPPFRAQVTFSWLFAPGDMGSPPERGLRTFCQKRAAHTPPRQPCVPCASVMLHFPSLLLQVLLHSLQLRVPDSSSSASTERFLNAWTPCTGACQMQVPRSHPGPTEPQFLDIWPWNQYLNMSSLGDSVSFKFGVP